MVLGLCIAFYAGAYASFSQSRLEWMALLFWAIFLFWQIFPVLVAGFGANFAFRTLLRFPLRPPRVLYHWVGVWVRRFLGARVGLLDAGYDCRSHGRQPGVLPAMAGLIGGYVHAGSM